MSYWMFTDLIHQFTLDGRMCWVVVTSGGIKATLSHLALILGYSPVNSLSVFSRAAHSHSTSKVGQDGISMLEMNSRLEVLECVNKWVLNKLKFQPEK